MPFYIWALHYGNENNTPLHIWRQAKFVTKSIRWMNDSILAWSLASTIYYGVKETVNSTAKDRVAENSNIMFISFLLRMMSGIGYFLNITMCMNEQTGLFFLQTLKLTPEQITEDHVINRCVVSYNSKNSKVILEG